MELRSFGAIFINQNMVAVRFDALFPPRKRSSSVSQKEEKEEKIRVCNFV